MVALDETAALLSKAPLFARMAPRELALVAGRMHRRTFRRGEVIVHRGDPAGSIHVIRSGSVKVALPTLDGGETVLTVFGPGACLGEMAALDGGTRSATLTAVEPTETLSLMRDDLLSLVRSSPELALSIIETLAARLRRANDWLEDAYSVDLDTRLARRLLSFAEDRGFEVEDGIRVPFPLTQSELAGMLGATRTTINGLLGDYQDTGLLRLEKGAFTVLRPRGLRRRAGLR